MKTPKTLTLFSCMLPLAINAEVKHVAVTDNSFTPQNIVIEAGDTVRWENFGNMLHNVSSTDFDYIFRCADGCDDNGGNGDIAGFGWVAEVTFHEPSNAIPYVCEPHIDFGMTGSVVVNVPTVSQTVTVDIGNGFSPSDITVALGSRVHFINQGGEHNIKADDDSFQCAQGCRDDGIEGDDEPTGFPWSIYKQFNQAGTIHYHCENPSHDESGVIHVVDFPIFSNGFETAD